MTNRILIERYLESDKQTLGKLYVLNSNDGVLKSFDSLELPYLNNITNISCIPTGNYNAIRHRSPKFGKCLWIQDVEGRTEILIHSGNFYSQIEGCILIGLDLKDINEDNYLDVVSSRIAIQHLMAFFDRQEEVSIEIIDK